MSVGCALFICLAPANGSLIGVENFERYLWMAADVATLAFLLQRRQDILAYTSANWLLLTWPLLAMASAAWSLTPGISFYHGLQLLMTILAGFCLRAAVGLFRFLRISFLALVFAQVLSIAAVLGAPGHALGAGNEWLGIYPHKNVFGSLMALQMLCAACLFLDRWCRPVTAAAFVLALALLYLSRSAAALSAAALSLVPLFAVAAWLRGRDVAGMALGVCIALAGIGCSVLASRGGELFAGALADLGKDNTLTGRTILWQFGIDQFWREPLLGIGYKAYWESPTTTAAYLHYSMKQKLWFFHNNFLDVAVAFGLVGLTVFVMGLLASARRSLTCLAHHPCYAGAWPLLFCLFVTVLSGFENVLFQNHSVQQFFLAAAMPPGALALARGMASRPRREGRSSPLGTGAARASPSMT